MFKRILVNTWRNVRRAPYQALAAVLVLTLTVFVSQVTAIISLGLQEVLTYFETRPQVTAFFTDEVNESAILTIKQQMEQQHYVSGVKYVSKQEAYAFYREQNKDDPLLLEMVTPDILPPSLEVSAQTAADLPQIRTDLEAVIGIDEVVYHADVIESLIKWTNGIRIVGLVLIGILSLLSILIMTTIISMKVAAKRDEISTMKLLGATPLFIHGPFVFEGALYGLIAATVAWLTTTILLLYATPTLVQFLGEIPLMPVAVMPLFLLWAFSAACATLLGMFSGSFSSAHYGK